MLLAAEITVSSVISGRVGAKQCLVQMCDSWSSALGTWGFFQVTSGLCILFVSTVESYPSLPMAWF